MLCELTLSVWDDGDGLPDRNSIKIGGDMDKEHANEVIATMAAVKFPAPAKIPFTPKLPGVITPQDLQGAPTHISYYEITVEIKATLPAQ
jgi:hypothetical protein